MAGSANLPVASLTGCAVGEEIGIGYGATCPTAAEALEQYEAATVTAAGNQLSSTSVMW